MAEAELAQSGMVRFVLVGQREGWSGYLGGGGTSRHKFAFNRGVCTLPFQEAEQASKRLKFHAAFPEGSKELAEAQGKWEALQHGSAKAPPVESGVQSRGQGTGEGTTDNGPGTDETETGDTGVVSDGDRQERTARAMSIEDALAIFDHGKDDQWTEDGKPKIKLIQDLCKDRSIKRDEIDAFKVTRQT